MPMIVDPAAPHISPPARVVSPDGWLAATVDSTWAGVTLAVDYTAGTPLAAAATVQQVRILRTAAGAPPVPVRSADPAWAVGGVGRAYDHEAPLGAAVIYTATPIYANGTTGPTSALAVTVPPPDAPTDVWLKSLEAPGLSVRVTVVTWPTLTWGARSESVTAAGSPYPTVAQDVYGAASSDIAVDAAGAAIGQLRALLTTGGVLLMQTRPEYYRPDQYVVLGDITEDLDGAPDEGRTFTAALTEVDRPDTTGQPLRVPGWSWDILADQYATWDAVAASYSSWASLSTNGVG